MKRTLAFLLVIVILLLPVIAIPNYNVQADSDHFTIAVLPDTQFYSQSYPAIFDQQAQWIVDNAQSHNIVFVAHLGDLQDDYDNLTEWQNAQHSMGIIRNAGIPYSVVPGNHDLNFSVGNPTYFDAYFPYSDFTDYSWYGDHYPATSNTSSYELFSAMGQDFMVLNLVCAPSLLDDDTTAWANNVLTQYAGRKAIVITHGYIDDSGSHISTSNTSGIQIWNNIVQSHSNVIAVLCGHIPGEYYSIDIGTGGNTIHNLLTDYQDKDNGGDGWLRLFEFYPQSNKITAVTYSPYLDQYDTSSYGQFDLYLDMGGNDARTATTVAVTSSVNPTNFNQSVTFTANITPIPDGGVVQFQDNGTNLGELVNIDNSGQATYSISTLSVGSHLIKAIYSGDYNFASSTGVMTQTVSDTVIWRLPEDINNDGVVNIGDVVMIGLHWAETGTSGWIIEDLNNDGVINIGDVVIVGLHWGETW